MSQKRVTNHEKKSYVTLRYVASVNGPSVCLSVYLFVTLGIVTSHKKNPYFVKRMRDIGPKTVPQKKAIFGADKAFFLS